MLDAGRPLVLDVRRNLHVSIIRPGRRIRNSGVKGSLILNGQLGGAQLDPAGADQEHAERDRVRVVRDRRGDLAGGPVTGTFEGDDVVGPVGQGGLRGEGPVEVPRLHDPKEQPGTARALRGPELATEGNRGAAVVVGEDLLGQPGEAFGLRHRRGEHRGPVVGGGFVVVPYRLQGVLGEAAAEHPVVQARGEGQVARLVPWPQVKAQVTRGPLGHRAALAGPGWPGPGWPGPGWPGPGWPGPGWPGPGGQG